MRRLIVLILLLGLCSCANRRINQFSTFADAGASYSDAMARLTQEAGDIFIDADSEHLLSDRDLLSEEQRSKVYFSRTKALTTLLATLRDLRVHTTLLKRYFMAIGQLAGSESPSTVTGQLSSVVATLEKIHPRLENATIGEAPVSGFIGAASPLVISGIKNKKLEDELRKNAGSIERELELQNALLLALSEQMKSDLELILLLKDHHVVSKPYIASPNLSEHWKDQRKEVLTAYLSLDAAEKAKDAASELKTAFLNLLENKTGPDGFKPLFEDINAMIDLIEMVAGRGSQ